MGSKSFTALPPSFRAAAKALGTGALLAALSSCITDGPNRTGSEYLTKHGITLQNPLYHVFLPEFPVDSFWTSDAEPSHLGDTILMAGVSGKFSSQIRLAFDLADTTFLDSVRHDDSTTFELSLATVPVSSVGLANLRAETDTNYHGSDSIPFLVETWAVPDIQGSGIRLTDAERADTLAVYNRRFLIRMDTSAVLPRVRSLATDSAQPILDTLFLKVKTAYTIDSVQSKPLPNLYRSLTAGPTTIKWLLQMQLTPLVQAGDSSNVMLRLANSAYGPSLLFGKPANAQTATARQKLLTAVVAGRRGMNHILRYSGSNLDMLAAKLRGLHLRLKRGALLDSVTASLQRQGVPVPAPNTNGIFDLTYFVPYGQISLPLSDSLSLEGGFPLGMHLASDLDSLLPYAPGEAAAVAMAPADKLTLLFLVKDISIPDKVLDTLSILYQKSPGTDSGLHRTILRFAKDSALNDTTYVRNGETKNIVLTIPGYGKDPLVLTLQASDTSIEVAHYLNTHVLTEPNDLRDPLTGALPTTLAQRTPRFLRAGQGTLTMRATNGIQSMLNRTDADTDVLPDFTFLPASVPAVDTTFNPPLLVSYPVLSVIPPKLVAGRLTVRLELYLYPLKKER